MKSSCELEKGQNKMSVISLQDARKRLENISSSPSQSQPKQLSDETGVKPIDVPTDEEVHEVIMAIYHLLTHAKQKPFTTKSDMARMAADIVAICAVEGFLSTGLPNGHYTNLWMVTQQGLSWLEEATNALTDR